MNKNYSQKLKKDALILSNLNGIPAYECSVRKYVKEQLKGLKGITFETDGLGSIAAIKKGKANAPTISLSCHMDEVGFMITKIEKDGFLRFQPMGGWWGHVVLAQKLTIVTESSKEYVGVVGAKPPHIITAAERSRVVKIEDMWIDIGAKDPKAVEELGISVGDMVVPTSESFMLPNDDFFVGKALDNRVAVAVGLEIMRQLNTVKHEANVIFVGTTQEEVGLRGARTSSYKWTPDVAFAIDVTIANDTPGMIPKQTKIGTGVALSLFDRSIIGNPKLIKSVEKTCKKYKIPYTFDQLAAGGTDAGAIHLTKGGIITMTISIPSRYIHTHNAIVSLSDMQSTANLLVNYIKDFTKITLKELKYK